MSELARIAKEARANSERWFPLVHDEAKQQVPLLVHYALGLTNEAGELAGVVKKMLRIGAVGTVSLDPEALQDELADVFIYLLLFADECGVDLERAYERKRTICEQRWG